MKNNNYENLCNELRLRKYCLNLSRKKIELEVSEKFDFLLKMLTLIVCYSMRIQRILLILVHYLNYVAVTISKCNVKVQLR